MGPGRFELPTSPLSGVRSNQLSYGPEPEVRKEAAIIARLHEGDATNDLASPAATAVRDMSSNEERET